MHWSGASVGLSVPLGLVGPEPLPFPGLGAHVTLAFLPGGDLNGALVDGILPGGDLTGLGGPLVTGGIVFLGDVGAFVLGGEGGGGPPFPLPSCACAEGIARNWKSML